MFLGTDLVLHKTEEVWFQGGGTTCF